MNQNQIRFIFFGWKEIFGRHKKVNFWIIIFFGERRPKRTSFTLIRNLYFDYISSVCCFFSWRHLASLRAITPKNIQNFSVSSFRTLDLFVTFFHIDCKPVVCSLYFDSQNLRFNNESEEKYNWLIMRTSNKLTDKLCLV